MKVAAQVPLRHRGFGPIRMAGRDVRRYQIKCLLAPLHGAFGYPVRENSTDGCLLRFFYPLKPLDTFRQDITHREDAA